MKRADEDGSGQHNLLLEEKVETLPSPLSICAFIRVKNREKYVDRVDRKQGLE